MGDLTQATRLDERLVLISAYFVPTERGVRRLVELSEQGVEVDIITNSLESTDAAVVHGPYALWRTTLLESGVSLYELRPEQEGGAGAEREEMRVPGASASALHIKAILFDDQLFVGSFNVDPRSVLWNTEVGVLMRSASLVEAFDALVSVGQDPAISYQVRLDAQGQLVWQWQQEGQLAVLSEEPGGWWRHFNAWVSRVLRLEKWL